MTITADLSTRAGVSDVGGHNGWGHDVGAHDLEGADWFSPLPGEHIAIRVAGEQTGGRLSVLEGVVGPLAGPPLHIHHGMDEVFYVIAGNVRFACGSRMFDAGPGGVVLIPRGTPHCFRNFGDAPARMLAVFTPGGIEDLFQSMAGRSPQEVSMLAEQWDTTVVGPQLEHGAVLR